MLAYKSPKGKRDRIVRVTGRKQKAPEKNKNAGLQSPREKDTEL